jgi:predicted RNA-binding protein YlqC (UPF0109 family)
MKNLVEYIAKALVDKPEAVKVSEIGGHGVIVYELKVAKEDMGRVLGRKGRNANAMRVLLGAAAGKHRKKVTLEIVEP